MLFLIDLLQMRKQVVLGKLLLLRVRLAVGFKIGTEAPVGNVLLTSLGLLFLLLEKDLLLLEGLFAAGVVAGGDTVLCSEVPARVEYLDIFPVLLLVVDNHLER